MTHRLAVLTSWTGHLATVTDRNTGTTCEADLSVSTPDADRLRLDVVGEGLHVWIDLDEQALAAMLDAIHKLAPPA